MKTYKADIIVTLPYTVQAEDFEQAEDYITEVFEDEYPDLKIFKYFIQDLKEVKSLKV